MAGRFIGMAGRLIGFALTLFVLWMPASRAADPVHIRIGWVVTPYEYIPIYFAQPGIARHLGGSYTYEPVHFQSAATMIPALASGELDIAPLTIFSLAAAIQNAKLDDLRIIGSDFEDGVPGYHSDSFMVLKDSPITKVEDLKGKSVASFGIGSAGDTAIRAMLRTHGVADNQYNTLEAAPPNMKSMLLAQKVDLVPAVGVFAFDPELQAKARTLFTQRDALGRVASVLVVRKGFLDANRAAIVDMLEDMVRAVRWYSDPANHQQVVSILANFTKQPPSIFADWVFTKKDVYHDPNGRPDVAAMQTTTDGLVRMNFLKAGPALKDYADLSLVDEADKRLK